VSEQNETTFWEGVEKECRKDGMSSSAAMLKSKWSWLQRSTQKYLAARTTVLGLQISGASPDDIAQQTMRVFRERAAMKGQGGKVILAPVFKFVEAANYLSTQPKFNVLYSGNSKTTISYRSSEVELPRETGAQILEDGDSEADSTEQDNVKSGCGKRRSGQRPIGVKKQKLMDIATRKDRRIQDGIKGMKEAMERAAAQSSANFQQLLDIQLLDRMAEGNEKKQLWAAISEERSLRIQQRTQLLASELLKRQQSSGNNSVATGSKEDDNFSSTQDGTKQGGDEEGARVDEELEASLAEDCTAMKTASTTPDQ